MNWISVKDKLPNIHEWVLLACAYNEKDDPNVFVGYRGAYSREDQYQCAYGDGYVPSDLEITHWAILPESPSVEQQKGMCESKRGQGLIIDIM